MRSIVSTRLLALCSGPLLAGTLVACGADGATGAAAHEVKADDDSCRVDEASLDAGRHVFTIDNIGSDVTEVYVYGKEGDDFSKIIGEQENIGPGTSRRLTVTLPAGEYEVACKPGMSGDGIRTPISVSGSDRSTGATEDTDAGYDHELEFEVRSDGTVGKPSIVTLSTGERVELKLENRSTAEYYIELLAPDGTALGEAEARGGQEAEFVADLDDAGDYTVKVFRDGREDDATTVTLTAAR